MMSKALQLTPKPRSKAAEKVKVRVPIHNLIRVEKVTEKKFKIKTNSARSQKLSRGKFYTFGTVQPKREVRYPSALKNDIVKACYCRLAHLRIFYSSNSGALP